MKANGQRSETEAKKSPKTKVSGDNYIIKSSIRCTEQRGSGYHTEPSISAQLSRPRHSPEPR